MSRIVTVLVLYHRLKTYKSYGVISLLSKFRKIIDW
jgi:hypothetical protein